MKILLPAAVIAVAALSACSGAQPVAQLDDQARAATATALKVDPETSAIEVSLVERGATSSSWSAHYEGKTLNCNATEHFKLPDCRVLQDTASN